jgi:hypothetical protein
MAELSKDLVQWLDWCEKAGYMADEQCRLLEAYDAVLETPTGRDVAALAALATFDANINRHEQPTLIPIMRAILVGKRLEREECAELIERHAGAIDNREDAAYLASLIRERSDQEQSNTGND